MSKRFSWSERKNRVLKEKRGISFERIVEEIPGALLDVRENPSGKHPNQRIFILNIENYPWVVPFEETAEAIFLITAFPDRRLKREFDLESQIDKRRKENFE
ncbi:MAG: toxin [SAR324 cluster bacterium]|nr:toxin [SAR324 cluster bacterium]